MRKVQSEGSGQDLRASKRERKDARGKSESLISQVNYAKGVVIEEKEREREQLQGQGHRRSQRGDLWSGEGSGEGLEQGGNGRVCPCIQQVRGTQACL